MIVILDYNIGNVSSIHSMYRYLDIDSKISSDTYDIKNASHLILPGVGSFDSGVNNLKKAGLFDVLLESALTTRTPILGICLGMQLLTRSSEEGNCPGLGLFDAVTKRFNFSCTSNLKIPHMGWNYVDQKKESLIIDSLITKPKFYFVHSYYVECKNQEDVMYTTRYGIEFASAISKGNIFGVQFHPEKSHKYGMSILKKFSEVGS